MIANEIKERIAENQALVDQIDSGQGGNRPDVTRDSVERSRALEKIIADQAALAELEATRQNKIMAQVVVAMVDPHASINNSK
jgi:hypothetical protein